MLEKRFAGDRSGACLAAAVIEGAGASAAGVVSRAFVCADPTRRRRARRADRVRDRLGHQDHDRDAAGGADRAPASCRWRIRSPRHLPKGTKVPRFQGQPIRLKHLTTHTSGLPGAAGADAGKDPDNPYAALTEAALLRSLGRGQAHGRARATAGTTRTSRSWSCPACWRGRRSRTSRPLLAERLFRPARHEAGLRRPEAGRRARGPGAHARRQGHQRLGHRR